jgi:hypothetical protein
MLLIAPTSFDRFRIDALRTPLRVAHDAHRLTPMFLLLDEIPAAAEAFAVKFADIVRRRRVLFGNDPFAALAVPRERLIARLDQVLLNLRLRLRASYMTRSLFEEQLVAAVADSAGLLGSAESTLLELERQPAASPKEALQRAVESFGDGRLTDAVQRISEAREQRLLPPGVAPDTVLALIDIAIRMQARPRLLRSSGS